MRDGFFPLHRKFFDHWLWQEKRVFSRAEAWIDMMGIALIADTRRLIGGTVYELKRGQITSSERVLADRWQWSRTKLRAFLKALELESMISQKKDRETTILTLLNYDRYALGETTKEPQKDHRKTTERPQKDQIGELDKERTREQSSTGELFPGPEERRKRAGSVGDVKPTQKEIEDFAVSIGLPASDGEHMFYTFEEKKWKGVANWQMTIRKYKSGGWLPSQKPARNSNGFHTTTGGLDKSKTIGLTEREMPPVETIE